jgi:hypothetical protein
MLLLHGYAVLVVTCFIGAQYHRVLQDGEKLVLKRVEETKVASAMHGLSR